MNDQEIKKMLEEAIRIQKEKITKAAMAAAAMAIDKAIEVEREACAKYVAESFGKELVDGQDVAAAIRARGE